MASTVDYIIIFTPEGTSFVPVTIAAQLAEQIAAEQLADEYPTFDLVHSSALQNPVVSNRNTSRG